MPDPRERAFAEVVERLQHKHGHFLWQAPFGHLITVIAQVQLALRHPDNTGYSARQAREILDAWIEHLEGSEPAVGEYLRMGFDPAHDVPREASHAD